MEHQVSDCVCFHSEGEERPFFGLTLQLNTFGSSVPQCKASNFPRADLEKSAGTQTGRSVQDPDTITLDHPEAETQGHP